MALKDIVTTIESLREEYQGLLPIKEEYRQKLDQKFMLEWNYNSNHIEGNTLTYGETKLLLVMGLAPGNHEMRELEEMKAHNVAIEKVKQYAEDKERPLTEAMIRELNKIILVEPFWAPAETPEGEPTRKKIIPGQYKTTPNNVKTPTGETFFFASPEETPAKMNDLLQWYEEAITIGHYDPWVAAELHYKLVRIHPFDDGNGRVARLLMNYHLLRTGYPPVIIKTGKKKEYLRALRQADAGDKDGLYEYVGAELIWSLELGLKAAKGEEVEEPGDIDKELELWKKDLDGEPEVKLVRSHDTVQKIFKTNFWPLIMNLHEDVLKLFSDMFFSIEDGLRLRDLNGPSERKVSLHVPKLVEQNWLNKGFHRTLPGRIRYLVNLKGFKKTRTTTPFDVTVALVIDFNEYQYKVCIEGHPNFAPLSYYYDEALPEEVAAKLKDELKRAIKLQIEASQKQGR